MQGMAVLYRSRMRFLLIPFFFGLLALGGCAEMRYGAVNFVTDPPGAEIVDLRNDTNLGTTPVRVSWEGKKGTAEKITVMLKKEGYHEKMISLGVNKRHESKTVAEANAVDMDVILQKKGGAQ